MLAVGEGGFDPGARGVFAAGQLQHHVDVGAGDQGERIAGQERGFPREAIEAGLGSGAKGGDGKFEPEAVAEESGVTAQEIKRPRAPPFPVQSGRCGSA